MNENDEPTGSVPRTPRSPDAPPAPVSTEAQGPLAIEFDGNASEYFGIWIVNLLLSIVTLGIYSPWAKIRRLRYFYGNTRLGNDGFDFLATGWQIFKGRVIVLLVLIAISSTQFIHPAVYIIASLAILPFVPWIINLSLRFRSGMTVWRNIRFGFEGTYWGAALVFLAMPLAGVLSLGLLFPLAGQMAARYVGSNYRYGTARFKADPNVGEFYVAFFIAAGVIISVMVVTLLVIAPLFAALTFIAMEPNPNQGFDLEDMARTIQASILPLLFVYFLGFTLASHIYIARTRNAVINSLVLNEEHSFKSDLSGLRLAWIAISNMFITIITGGLMHPWAAVRIWRYQASRYQALPAGEIDNFVDAQKEAVSAFGTEFADFEGFDIGIGL